MKVLHVVNYGWPHVDGYTARSRNIVHAQRRELGIETEVAVSPFPVFAHAQDPTLRANGWGPDQHQVQSVPAASGAARTLLRRLQRPTLGLAPGVEGEFRRGLSELVEEVRPDVIHAHHPAFVGRSAQAVAKDFKVPFVYEVRCFNGDYDLDARNPYFRLRGHRQNSLEMALARSADQVVTISSGLAARLLNAGVAPQKVHVIRNAVDTTLWTPVEHHLEPGVVRVGYATTFEAIEGLDGLLHAVAKAAPKLAATGLTLQVVLAGAGRDWERINSLVDELGLRDVVSLPGFLSLTELRALYSELDLFIISRGPAAVASDTTPLKPLEALAAGLPLLATDLPAMRELLNGRPGVRFVPATPEGLAEGILAFAEDSWRSPVPADLGDRSWANEVRRYADVYAAVGAHV